MKWLVFALLWAALPAHAADLENARARQEGNRAVLTYDLVADGPVPVTASDDGGKTWNVKLGHLTGDVGEAVAPGRGKSITWDALRDYPRDISIGALVFELNTSGGNFTDPFTGMEFVCIQGGTFEMGDTFGDGDPDERPVHSVTVSAFCIGKTEVTQAQWQQVMGAKGADRPVEKYATWDGVQFQQKTLSNPSYFNGTQRPVEYVSWDDVQEFLQELKKTGKTYRLPTEAEWEYAARSGGKNEKWARTSSVGELGQYAWYGGAWEPGTRPVGTKQPNGLGLYDMIGNVWEWCQAWYGSYPSLPQRDPQGPSLGSSRVIRGGNWTNGAEDVRAVRRMERDSDFRGTFLGFRLATVQ